MELSIEFKSDFGISKLTITWLILLVVFIFPWLLVLFQLDKGAWPFAIFVNILVLAIIVYVKIGVKIIIDPQWGNIIYHYRKLWGEKHEITIDIKNATVNLDIINYRFNHLWKLTVIDNNDMNKKISVIETEGFDGQQIKQMHQAISKLASTHL